MRDYQTKANKGGAADSITSTKWGAGEFNSLATENENAVSRSGLTLAPADGTGEDTTQLAQSLFLHSVKSQSFQAGGTVDAITLTPISGSSGVVIPSSYDNMEGAIISFDPSGTNTGAVTVSIGQTSGTQLSTKKLLDSSGVALTGGELSSRVEIYYDPAADSSNGAWILNDSENDGIGVGQTWQNVAGSRSSGVSYQNTTGKPIMVSVTTDTVSEINNSQVSIDGMTWVTIGVSTNTAVISNTFIVPNAHYYRVQQFTTWAELRT